MQNKNPKSELPALKEKAGKEKDKEARLKSIDKERAGLTDWGPSGPRDRSKKAK